MAKLSFSKSVTRITVNGQTYNSVDEMPPDVRQQYEKVMAMMADKNNNGIPDALEGVPKDGTTVVRQVSTTQTVGRRALKLMPFSMQRDPLLDPAAFASTETGGGIRLRWPTLIAIILTAVVVTMMLMWGVKH